MAPLRSSRSTRHQDHSAASRNRPGVVDLDPTEGLPVQKWEQITVRINQDPSSDPLAATTLPQGTTATSSAEWSAQFGTPQFPWQEKDLPSFYSQLPPWNQEMLRRARTGNTSAKLSVWERKSNSWISAAEAEKRQNPLKSVHLNNVEPSAGSKQNTGPDSPAHDDDDDHDEKSDDEIDGENGDDEIGPTTTPGTKRRKKYVPEERIFEVKRWVQMPSAIADKTEERKFLADRRPGMPSLYGGTYQTQVFGSMGLNTNGYGFSAANAGYDLGDGGGLGNAGGMLLSQEAPVTPVRKNMPPKRKKKKGGPGRKKANPDPVPQASQDTAAGEIPADGAAVNQPIQNATSLDADNEGSDSGSEAEGSEEGEIDEGGKDQEKQNGHVENQVEFPIQDEVTDSAPPITDGRESMSVTEPSVAITPNVESVAMLDASNNEPEQLPPEAPMDTTEDITMQDQPTEEELPIGEPMEIPSIMQPSVSAQTQEVPLPTESPHAEISEVSLDTALPVQESMTDIPQSQLPELPQPLETEPTVEPSLPARSPIIDEPTTAIVSEMDPTPSSTTIQGLSPVPNEQPPFLPPPSPIAEEGTEPLNSTPTAHALIEPLAEVPALPATPNVTVPETVTESAPPIDTKSVLQVPTDTAAFPEPISPDLLGGLEDELDKNMGEENAE